MSEPQHIKEILPGVMLEIERRMKRQRRQRVVSAVGDFMSCKLGRNKRSIRQKAKQGVLW